MCEPGVSATNDGQVDVTRKSHLKKKNASKPKNLLRKNSSIGYPTNIPDLSYKLQLADNNNILKKNDCLHLELVRDLAADLMKRTSGEPNREDYANYSLAAVDKYPFLGSDSSGQRNVSLDWNVLLSPVLWHFFTNINSTQQDKISYCTYLGSIILLFLIFYKCSNNLYYKSRYLPNYYLDNSTYVLTYLP